ASIGDSSTFIEPWHAVFSGVGHQTTALVEGSLFSGSRTMQMLKTSSRCRCWLAALTLVATAVLYCSTSRGDESASQPATTQSAAAEAPAAPPAPAQPDPIGAYQTTPTAVSVPGYTKPDPDKATVKDVAVAVDAVAQSASHTF